MPGDYPWSPAQSTCPSCVELFEAWGRERDQYKADELAARLENTRLKGAVGALVPMIRQHVSRECKKQWPEGTWNEADCTGWTLMLLADLDKAVEGESATSDSIPDCKPGGDWSTGEPR